MELVHFDRARRALEKASQVDEEMAIRDKAEAARAYAKQIDLSLEMQNQCCEIKLRAERRMGEILSTMNRRGRGQRSQHATFAPSLADLGITKSQSSRWQTISSLPAKDFERYIDATKERGWELTSAGAIKLAKQAVARAPTQGAGHGQAEGVVSSLEDLVHQKASFGCILADPPWRYGNQGTRAATGNHYDTMSVEEIAALPVGDLAAEQAHLHLWTTNGFLFEAKEVMEAWGFIYKSVLVWVKPEMGLGNYWRVAHEYLLLGVRGSAPFRSKSHRSWFEESRCKHSAKPTQVREMVGEVSPGPYLEIFGREQVRGWTVWGNQVA